MQPRECLWSLLSCSHRYNSAVIIAYGVLIKLFLLARYIVYVRTIHSKVSPTHRVTAVIDSFSILPINLSNRSQGLIIRYVSKLYRSSTCRLTEYVLARAWGLPICYMPLHRLEYYKRIPHARNDLKVVPSGTNNFLCFFHKPSSFLTLKCEFDSLK